MFSCMGLQHEIPPKNIPHLSQDSKSDGPVTPEKDAPKSSQPLSQKSPPKHATAPKRLNNGTVPVGKPELEEAVLRGPANVDQPKQQSKRRHRARADDLDDPEFLPEEEDFFQLKNLVEHC